MNNNKSNDIEQNDFRSGVEFGLVLGILTTIIIFALLMIFGGI